MIASERFFRVGIDAAGTGTAPHQEGHAQSDDQHDAHADEHGEDRSRRSRDGEERRSGHDERAPADHAAEGHSQYVDRIQIPVQCFLVDSVLHILLSNLR